MIDKKSLINWTRQVIAINSENPPGREEELARFIEKQMKALGLEVKTYAYAPRRPNVVVTLKGSWPRAKAHREAILITPHIDTVPIGSGWTVDPLGGQIRQGKIYGRGASDDKGNLASCLAVMKSLVEDKVVLKRDVIMAATVDEETGSKKGVLPLLAKKVLKPKVALILDADEANAIIAQKGLIHSRVQIFGRKAHGAYNWQGVNAIELAAAVIEAIKRHKFKFVRHPLLRPPTTNIGVIKGGDKVNMVADFCEFALDVRYLPGMNPENVLRDIKAVIRRVTKNFKLVIDDLQLPYEIPAAHPLVATYIQSAKKVKMRCDIKASEGATVMTFFRKYHIPAFASGYGAKGTAHTTDEYARVETLYRGTRLLEQFLKDYDSEC